MKQVLIALSLLAFLGCKKNKETAHGVALSKQFMNNILISEWTYAANGKVAKEKSYNEQTGIFSYAVEFEYDSNGRLLKEKQYNSTNKLSGIVSYYWKSNGQLEKHEYLSLNGADSGKITVRVRYTYDLEGRIIKQSWVDLITDQVYDSREMGYYKNNNLQSLQGHSYSGGTPELKYKVDYSSAGDSIPPEIIWRSGYVIDFRWPEYVADKMHYSYYNNGIITTETNTLFTHRQYNDKGFLKSQTTTIKKIKPIGADVVNEIRYEYIEL